MHKKKKHNIRFKVLWARTFFAVAVDELYGEKLLVPLANDYYYWPREDGWKLLQEDLDSKPLICNKLKEEILQGYTTLIQYWITNGKKNIFHSKAKVERECSTIWLTLVAEI
jgi:hypothetical protein